MDIVLFWVVLVVGLVLILFVGPWWMGPMLARRRIARLLQPDEIILQRAETLGTPVRRFSLLSLFPYLWQGTLYLTNRRVIWRRYLFAYFGPSLWDIPLERVDECSVRKLGWFGSLLQIKVGDELLLFHPYSHRLSLSSLHNTRFAEDIAGAINEARAVAQRASP